MKSFNILKLQVAILLIANTSIAQNNIGIGTTSPSPNAILDLRNNGATLGLVLPRVVRTDFSLGAGDYGLFVYDTIQSRIYFWDGSNWQEPLIASGGFITGSGTTNEIPYFTSGTNLSSGTNFSWDNSNERLGIGTASPDAKLDLEGPNFEVRLKSTQTNTGASVIMDFGRDNGGGGFTETGSIGTPGSGDFFRMASPSALAFNVNFSDRMWINSSGNVGIGIGSTSPLGRLEVEGSNTVIYVDNTGGFSSVDINNSTGGLPLLRLLQSGAVQGGLLWDDASATLRAYINGESGQGVNIRSGGRTGIGETAPVNTLDVNGGMAIGATFSGTNTAPSNGLIVQENVGIGTPSPSGGSYRLHVHRASTSSLAKFSTTATGIGVNDGFNMGYVDAFGAVFMVTENAGLRFGTNSSYHSITDASGNWGLGVLTPVNRLDVEGGVAIGASYSGASTAPTNGLIVQGNVGIGTNTTTLPFEVRDAVSNTTGTDGAWIRLKNAIAGTGTVTTGIIFNTYGLADADKAGIFFRRTGGFGIGDLIFNTNTAFDNSNVNASTTYQRMILTSTGNLGIANTGPTERLVVGGNIFATGGDLYTSASNGVINCGGGIMDAVDNIISDAAPTPAVTIGDQGLYVDGNLQVGQGYKPGGGAWITTSDSRLKKNVRSYSEGLEQVMQINPVRFQYNEKMNLRDGDQDYVGILAQEMKEIAPHTVGETYLGRKYREDELGNEILVEPGEGPYYTFDGTALTFMLINAVKEQQLQIEELKAEIEDLKKEE